MHKSLQLNSMVLVMNIAASQKELNYLISEERKQNKPELGLFIPVIPPDDKPILPPAIHLASGLGKGQEKPTQKLNKPPKLDITDRPFPHHLCWLQQMLTLSVSEFICNFKKLLLLENINFPEGKIVL